MSRDLDNAFNDCLERMSSGEDIQQCVGRYPEYLEELLPLLQTAMATEQVASEATDRAEAKARGLSRLMEALNDRGVPRKRGVSFFFLRPLARPVAMGLGALLLVGFAAGGTAVASSNSVPGDTLYWVKTARENISLRFPPSDMERAQAHGVPATAINSPSDILRDPYLRERGYFVEADHAEAGRLAYAGRALFIDGEAWEMRRAAPLLGEHNEEVLCGGLGFSTAEAGLLRAEGVI